MLFKEQEKVKKKPKAIYLQVRVKEDEKQALKEMADKYNMTLTDFIKNACNEYAKILDKQEK